MRARRRRARPEGWRRSYIRSALRCARRARATACAVSDGSRARLLQRGSGPQQLTQCRLDAPEDRRDRSRDLRCVSDPTDGGRRLDEVAAAVVELVVRCANRGRAGGRREGSWRARWCHAAFGVELCSSSATLAGASIVAATSSLVRAQHAAALRSAAAVSWSEASSSACRSCDGPAPPRPPGQLAAARAYRHEMLSWESPGGMRAFAPAWQPRLRACNARSTQSRVAGRNAAHARSPAPCWRRSAAESSVSESCASRMRGSSMTCSLVARASGIHGGETATRPDQDTLVARGKLGPCARD